MKKIAILLSLIINVSATQLKVPSAYSTIQAGLNAASSGDTVLVAVGTYTENIIWPNVNGIKLISAGDSSNTIIDGNQAGSVITISYNQIDSTTVISGFTITGGGSTNRGGGIALRGSPKITKSNINYNSANSEGGGLHLQGSSPLIIDVTIHGNVQNDNGGTVNNGGGICMSDGSSPLLKNVIISKNSSQNAGGMFISYDSNPTLENVIISHNTNEGIYLWSSSLKIKNVKIAHNGGYGIRMIRESTLSKCENLVIENNNSAGIYIAQTTPITISNVSLLNNIYPFQIVGGSSVTFENNTIFSNSNPDWIYFQDNKSTIKLSNLIENGKMIAGSGVAFQAINNYWGHSSGPFNSETNPMGKGDTIDNNIAASPWLSSPNLDAPPIPARNIKILSKNRKKREVSIAWNSSEMSDISGYKIHYDFKENYPLSNSLDVKNDTSYTFSGNFVDGSNILSVSSYDNIGNESGYSEYLIFKLNDPTAPFEWVSSALDTINITKLNLTSTYNLQWGISTATDGDSINYLLYAKIGVNPPEEIFDTTSTSVPITYQEFLENIFEPFPTVSAATVRFTVYATDGLDTVKVTGDDRVVLVNRYEYLSTESDGIPTEYALHENYPNPFNPTTTLRFDLPEVSDITLTIYNMLGQKVKTFNMQSTPAGYHSVTWNATNDLGNPVGAGVYLYQLQAKDFVKTRKMVLLK